MKYTFDFISLEKMDRVRLMNRFDSKCWFKEELLPELFSRISDDYYLLNISGEADMKYESEYYDTPDNRMYLNHHNGKLNRYKVRRRKYLTGNVEFLEIKFKNNKRRTLKQRIPSGKTINGFNKTEAQFINDNTPYRCERLVNVLSNSFRRFTLVNKNFNERCTIDHNLMFKSAAGEYTLQNIAIVELKQPEMNMNSPMNEALRSLGIKPGGFSKYCMGRTLLEPALKKNTFLPKYRLLHNIPQDNDEINTPSMKQLLN